MMRLAPLFFISSLRSHCYLVRPLDALHHHRCSRSYGGCGSIFASPIHSANKQSIEFHSSSPALCSTKAPFGKEPVVFETRSQLQLERLGAGVARVARRGDVFLLRGVVGAGKTCFARGFIRGLTRDPTLVVTSPTYLLDNVYKSHEGISVHHMDLYRLKQGADLSILGIPDVFETCISLIEWPERFAFPLRGKHFEVDIDVVPLEQSAEGATGAGDVASPLPKRKERLGRRTRILPVVGESLGATDLALLTNEISEAGLRALNKTRSYKRIILGP